MTNLLFIIGAQKSGTSTMVGMLNSHPDIFIAHEWFIDSVCTKYGLDFFRYYRVDERERLKKKKPLYNSFQNFIKVLLRNGYNYRYAGDKWPRTGSYKVIDKRINELKDIHTIYMVRDLRTWLQHKMVSNIYAVQDDILDIAIRYSYYFVRSFLLSKCLHVSMENMIHFPDQTVLEVANFLKIDGQHMNQWWEKIGNYTDENKLMHRWWERHESATVEPKHLDIQVNISDHQFWNDILPIFDKYYKNLDGKFEKDEIQNDINTLLALADKWKKISINVLYDSVDRKSVD